ATAIGPDLSRGTTQATDVKRPQVREQETRAVEEALGAVLADGSAQGASPFEPGEHAPAA
ncbi:MAG: hypothetical protein ACO3TS_11965, partial [Candidatus Nanopelagicales bacterium]